MLNANVSWNRNLPAFEAGKDTVTKALKGKDSSLLIIFNSSDYDQNQFLAGAKSAAGETPIIGTTSFLGVLTPDGFISGEHGYSCAMSLYDESLKISVAGAERGSDPIEAGREAAKKALAKAGTKTAPAFFCMFATPGEDESYLRGIQDVIGRVPMFGGGSADNKVVGNFSQYIDDLFIPNGVVVAFFYTDKKFASEYTGGFRFTGKSGVMTKVENKRIIKEIDNRPALEVYAEWRGMTPQQVNDELKGTNLGAVSVNGTIGFVANEDEMTWIRHPTFGGDDLSMTVGHNVYEHTAISLMEATNDELVDAVPETVEKAKEKLAAEMGALIAIHCGGRAGFIFDRMDEVCSKIKDVVGDTPFIGLSAFGEYGYGRWTKNGCGGLMLNMFMLEK